MGREVRCTSNRGNNVFVDSLFFFFFHSICFFCGLSDALRSSVLSLLIVCLSGVPLSDCLRPAPVILILNEELMVVLAGAVSKTTRPVSVFSVFHGVGMGKFVFFWPLQFIPLSCLFGGRGRVK